MVYSLDLFLLGHFTAFALYLIGENHCLQMFVEFSMDFPKIPEIYGDFLWFYGMGPVSHGRPRQKMSFLQLVRWANRSLASLWARLPRDPAKETFGTVDSAKMLEELW